MAYPQLELCQAVLSTSVNYYSTTALRSCALAPSFLWIVRQLAFSQFRPSIVEGCYWLSKASGPVQQRMASDERIQVKSRVALKIKGYPFGEVFVLFLAVTFIIAKGKL